MKNLVFNDAKIIFKNFSGKESQYNRAGDRNFCVVIENDDYAKEMTNDGWNIKVTKPKDPEMVPTPFIQIKIRYDVIPPKIWSVIGKSKVLLTADTVGELDFANFEHVDVEVSPYEWTVNGKTGVTGYVRNMYVTIERDPFADKYEFDSEDVVPF